MEKRQTEKDTAVERLIFLSDGVFAIAITLLVLEVVPDVQAHLPAAQLLDMFLDLRRPILTYALSFIIVSLYWTTHQRIFQYIERTDTVLTWLNIFFLLNVSFLPVPTKVLELYGDQQAAVIFYVVSLAITALFPLVIWWYATWHYRLVDKQLAPRLIRYHLQRSLIAPSIFLLSVSLSFISPYLAEFSWLSIGVVIVIHEYLYHHHSAVQQRKPLEDKR